MSPSPANPVLDEIDRAHAALSPPAKQALSLFSQTQPQAQPQATDPGALARPAMPAPAPENPMVPGMIGVRRAGLPPSQPQAATPADSSIARPASRVEVPEQDPEQALPLQTAGIRIPPTTPDGNQQTPQQVRRAKHIDNLDNLENSPSGASQIHNPFLRGLAHAGEIAESTFFPMAAVMTPGTQMHHDMLVGQARHAVTSDEGQQQAQDKSRLENAQAAEQESLPDLHQTQADLAATKAENARSGAQSKLDLQREQGKGKLAAILASRGEEQDETGNIVPLPYERLSEPLQAVHDLKAAQSEQADATAALKKAQAANQPAAAALAQKRLDSAAEAHNIASQRLGLSEKQFALKAGGDSAEDAHPGQLIDNNDRTIGTAFQQNVRPTGQERNRADLANSAHQQLGDLKDIVSKRPDIFGPAAGRTTDFQVWLGSQDPDAQRFRAARTIAGDHLAGVFGGRSEAALKALDAAIGQFKDNPKALEAGLDQLDRANAGFQKAGTVKASGSDAAKGSSNTDPKVGDTKKFPNGKTGKWDGTGWEAQ